MFEMNIAMNKVKMKYLKEAITIGTFFFFSFLFVLQAYGKSLYYCVITKEEEEVMFWMG